VRINRTILSNGGVRTHIDMTSRNLNLEETKMATLGEEAKNYESQQTKNIADLEVVSTDLSVEDREGTDKEGKAFKYKVITVNNFEYRVPASVLNSLKAILKENPSLKTFKVTKSGTGLNTEYTVIPLA